MLLRGDVEHLVEGVVPDLMREGVRPSAPRSPHPASTAARPGGGWPRAGRTVGRPLREATSRGPALLALQSNVSEMGPPALVEPLDAAAPASSCPQPRENGTRTSRLSCPQVPGPRRLWEGTGDHLCFQSLHVGMT